LEQKNKMADNSSVNFYANQLKVGIWKERPIKKNIVEVTFFLNIELAV
jgi:hypothetical protein